MSETTQDDRSWIHAALDEYERPLTHYAARVVGDLDRARDVVQDVFLKLCNQREEDLAGGVREWLFTVCRNRALDVRRKERPMVSAPEDLPLDRPSTARGPSAQSEHDDSVSLVLGTLAALPTNQAEVIRLKFQHGLTYKEISRVTELSIGNVGFLLHVGLKTLRERLGGKALLTESLEGTA